MSTDGKENSHGLNRDYIAQTDPWANVVIRFVDRLVAWPFFQLSHSNGWITSMIDGSRAPQITWIAEESLKRSNVFAATCDT